MSLSKRHLLLLFMSLLNCGRCLSKFACNTGYFGPALNVAATRNDLAAAVKMNGVLSPIRCTAMCLEQHNCRSAVYDRSSKTCYQSSDLLNLTAGVTDSTSSYVGLSTTCNDLNGCGLSTVCSATPMSRNTYLGCIDAKNQGNIVSGPYYLDPDGSGSFLVWCDFIGNEAWAVFQRRLDGSVDFYRGWTDYKNGFGNVNGEYWLGLERIYRLTKTLQPKLNIYLGDFVGASRTANYSSMSISNEASSYTLTLGSYIGDAGDALGAGSGQSAIGMQFTTNDRDNDASGGENCAVHYQGAWWYRSCHDSNLNGLYLRGAHNTFANGVNWNQWKGYYYSLKTTIMRVAI